MPGLSTFILVQEGRPFAPVTIRAEELLLGRGAVCALQLNDPTVPLVLSVISEIDGRFYFERIEASRFDETKQISITINGRELIGKTALAVDDSVVIGEYRLIVDSDNEALVLRVTHSEPPTQAVVTSPAGGLPKTVAKIPAASSTSDGSHSGKTVTPTEQWAKRRLWKTRDKVAGSSYLKPRQQKVDLGTQYNWSPTTDLAEPWPVSFFLICFVGVFGLAVVAFMVWPSLFAPGQISRAHVQTKLSASLLIASTPNGNSCMRCHQVGSPMDRNCAGCHQAAGFHANITKAHEDAGIGCTDCHSEHQGRDFSARAGALVSCQGCHNDQNKRVYNGKSVHTPHDGTFGYPVTNGRWIWLGLDEEALKLKPEVALHHLALDSEQQWRSKQFHAIHLYRVKIATGINDVKDGVLQCSSCHQAFGEKLDRETPRHTCAKCHNGSLDSSSRFLANTNSINCISCHVQHYYDVYRWGDLLTESEHEKRQRAIDSNYGEAIKRAAGPP